MCPGFCIYFIVSQHEALPLLILPSHAGGGGGGRGEKGHRKSGGGGEGGEGETERVEGKAERVEKAVKLIRGNEVSKLFSIGTCLVIVIFIFVLNICLCAGISIPWFGYQGGINAIFIQEYLASYLVYGAQKTQYEHSRKIGISETNYLMVGLVGEIIPLMWVIFWSSNQ